MGSAELGSMCSDIGFMCINIVIHMGLGKSLYAAVYAAILFLSNLVAAYAPWIFGLQDCRPALRDEEMARI